MCFNLLVSGSVVMELQACAPMANQSYTFSLLHPHPYLKKHPCIVYEYPNDKDCSTHHEKQAIMSMKNSMGVVPSANKQSHMKDHA